MTAETPPGSTFSSPLRDAVLEQLPDALIVIDDAGVVLEWSRASEELFQWTRSEVVGRKLSDFILPSELREAHDHGVERVSRTGHGPVLGKRMVLPALRRDGARISVSMRITPVRLEGRHCYAAVLHDAADRVQLERAAAEHAARRDVLSAQLGSMVAALDDQRDSIHGLTATLDMLLAQDLAVGHRQMAEDARALVSSLADSIEDAQQSARRTSSADSVDEQPAVKADLVELVHAAVSGTAAAASARAVVTDIDIEPSLPRHVLVRAAGLRRLIANVTRASLRHTPTGSLLVTVRRDEAPAGGSPDQIILRMIIASSATRRFTTQEIPAAVPLDYGPQAASAVAMGGELRVDAADGGRLVVTLTVPVVEADTARIISPIASRRVAWVRGATSIPGLEAILRALEVELAMTEELGSMLDETQGRFDVVLLDRESAARASDAQIAALERRVRTPERDIAILAAPGQGTWTSWMAPRPILLRPLGLDQLTAIVRGDAAPVASTSKVVLVVEDDPNIQRLLSRYIGDAGHVVQLAADGVEGAQLATRAPRPDLILMDLDMPLLDGVGATAMIRDRESAEGLARVPIVAVTAHAFADVRVKAITVGIDEFVAKPVHKARVVDLVRRAADGRRVVVLLDTDSSRRLRLCEELGAAGGLRIAPTSSPEEARTLAADPRTQVVLVSVGDGGPHGEAQLLAHARSPAVPVVALLDPFDEAQRVSALREGFAAAVDARSRESIFVEVSAQGSTGPAKPEAAKEFSGVEYQVDDDLVDLVGPFLERQAAELERALSLIDDGGFDEVKRVGHRLKGTGGSFGLTELAGRGEALEAAAAAKNIVAARACVIDLLRATRGARVVGRSMSTP